MKELIKWLKATGIVFGFIGMIIAVALLSNIYPLGFLIGAIVIFIIMAIVIVRYGVIGNY